MSRWAEIQKAMEFANVSGHLDLSGLQLREIPPVALTMTHLVSLNLSSNNLEKLPVEIGGMTHLKTLSLSRNKLKSLPWTLGNLHYLESLEVDGNPLEVSSNPFEITIAFDIPSSSYEDDYKHLGGFAIYMVSYDGSRSHKPFKAVDLQGVSDIVHIATVRPSVEFTYRSPCHASHPRTREYTVKDLQPAERYAFSVKALCSDPASLDSEMSDFVEIMTMPTQISASPADLEVVAYSWESVALTWEAPEDYGFPIEEYVIYCCEAGDNGLKVVGRTTLHKHQVSHLEADTLYHFAVVAVNCAGSSLPSSKTVSTLAALPTIKPAPPAVDEVSFFYTVLSWDYPTMRGSDITGMEVQMRSDGQWSSVGTVPVRESKMMQGSLEPGCTYWFRLRTHSLTGPSEWSADTEVSTRTAEMPGRAFPPVVVEAMLSFDSVTVQWGPDLMSDFDGPQLLHWELQMQDCSHSNWKTITAEPYVSVKLFREDGVADDHISRSVLTTAHASQFTAIGLFAGSEYRFRVRAANEAGTGEWSDPTTVTTKSKAPDQPGPLVVTGETLSSLSLRMTRPKEYGADILAYCVQRRTTRPWYRADAKSAAVVDVSAWYSVGEFPPGVTEFTVSEDLEAGATHSFRYCVLSNAGESVWSETLDYAMPPALPPAAPVITMSQVTDDGTTVTIAWSVPPHNGAMVNGYELWSLSHGAKEWKLIYTGIHNMFEDDSVTDVMRPPVYRVRAITDETPPSPFSEPNQAVPLDVYGDLMPIIVKGHWGPQHMQVMWVSRNESVTSLRHKIPPEMYPTGKIAGFDDESQVRLVCNGKALSEEPVPKAYGLVVSDETGGNSSISGHDIVMSRDLSFARVYNRLLRHTKKSLRKKQESVRVCDDRVGNATVYHHGDGYTETNGPFIELGHAARVIFRKCARVPVDGDAHSLPPRGPHFPLFDVKDFAKDPEAHVGLDQRKISVLPDVLSNGTALVPMFQKEAMWMEFSAREPVAVKCTSGRSNCLTGQTDVPLLMKIKKSHTWPPHAQQNYMVVPQQRWLTDRNTGTGNMVQFTPLPLNDASVCSSLTISAFPLLKSDAQVFFTPKLGTPPVGLFISAEDAGLRSGDVVYLRSFSLPGVHPATLMDHGITPHSVLQLEFVPREAAAVSVLEGPPVLSMSGFSGGGRIAGKVFPDLVYGAERWDVDVEAAATVHMVNSHAWCSCTGLPMPETQISLKDYKKIGLPKAYLESWDEEPDTKGIFSKEVSEIDASAIPQMFQMRGRLVARELRKGWAGRHP